MEPNQSGVKPVGHADPIGPRGKKGGLKKGSLAYYLDCISCEIDLFLWKLKGRP